MFFPIDAEEWSKALGQIRRLRHRGNWRRIGSSDAYWNAPFFAALVDTVDSLLLEHPDQALELSSQAVILAERIRTEDCPGRSEMGRRSLQAWAHAAQGSSYRRLERYSDSERAFQWALGCIARKVLPWAAAEVWRRYAALLLSQGSPAAFDYVDKALKGYAGFPAGKADAFVLRGGLQMYLQSDLSAAALDTSKALELLEPKRSTREARTWTAAIHNLGVYYSRDRGQVDALEGTLKRVRRCAANLSRHEPYRRVLCLWLEALLLAPLGLSRRSQKLLDRARKWLSRHGHHHQSALCAVDLALIHFQDGDEPAGRAVLAELPGLLAATGSPLVAFPEHRLAAAGGGLEIGEESLVSLRETLDTLSRRPRTGQPLGMMMGPTSSEGGEVEEFSPETAGGSTGSA